MKNQKGITLIALVITIIVLLILAGVSIAMLTGDNGILTKAVSAGEKSDEGAAKEAVRLAVAELITENDGKMPTDGDKKVSEQLQAKLEAINDDFTYTVTDADTMLVTITKGEKNFKYDVVKKSGKITVHAGE